MSLASKVEAVVDKLPSEVSDVLRTIAAEVDKHSAVLDGVEALIPQLAPAVTVAEDVAKDVEPESPQAATTVPTETSTNGEAEPQVGNPEQQGGPEPLRAPQAAQVPEPPPEPEAA